MSSSKFLTSINLTIRNCVLVAASAVVLVSCGGGGGDVPPWIGTKQLGVAGNDTYGFSVAADANGNVYVAGDTVILPFCKGRGSRNVMQPWPTAAWV